MLPGVFRSGAGGVGVAGALRVIAGQVVAGGGLVGGALDGFGQGEGVVNRMVVALLSVAFVLLDSVSPSSVSVSVAATPV